MTERRRFNSAERVALYVAADGRCTLCGVELEPGWHADHERPWSAGGATDVTNGQALCPTCNLKKGARHVELRKWQEDALAVWEDSTADDVLVIATPGAGKTTLALAVAASEFAKRRIDRVAIVVPTAHLKEQWTAAAHTVGIELDPDRKNADGHETRDYHGRVLTYQQVAAESYLHRRHTARSRTLVILDEVHHAGEKKAWGTAIIDAFGDAARRLSLSGTPFRSDGTEISFLSYDDAGLVRADYQYGYGNALEDDVCRPVEFHFYDGEMRWTYGTKEDAASLSDARTDEQASRALNTALNPDAGWMGPLLEAADRQLSTVREDAPDAGGLIIASSQFDARAYAAMIERISGEPAVVAISDDKDASLKIEQFAHGRQRWLVAVFMVSEGVDIPRLAVGVYATNVHTRLFFVQAVGRFVRRRANEEHNAVIFAPTVKKLRGFAAELEATQLEVLNRFREKGDGGPGSGGGSGGAWPVPLDASEPFFDQAILAGDSFSAAAMEEAEALCLKNHFPLRCAAQLAVVLREERAVRAVLVDRPTVAEPAQKSVYQRCKLLRGQRDKLVKRYAYQSGLEVQAVHTILIKRWNGKGVADLTVDDLEAQIKLLQSWMQ